MGCSVVVVDAVVAGVVVGPSVVDDEDTALDSVEVVAVVVVDPSVVDDEDTAANSVVASPSDSGDPLQLDKATRATIASQ
jgi:hypothetical protein